MKIQLDGPVSRVRGWQLSVKLAISQGQILGRPEFWGTQHLGMLWDLGSVKRSVCVCVHEAAGDTGTLQGRGWMDRMPDLSCWVRSVSLCVWTCVCLYACAYLEYMLSLTVNWIEEHGAEATSPLSGYQITHWPWLKFAKNLQVTNEER